MSMSVCKDEVLVADRDRMVHVDKRLDAERLIPDEKPVWLASFLVVETFDNS